MNSRQKKKWFRYWDNPIYTTIADEDTIELYRRGKLIERKVCVTQEEYEATWDRFTNMKHEVLKCKPAQ